MQKDGKTCVVTIVTIIMFEQISAKLHLPLKRSFCERPEHSNVSSPVTFVTHKLFAVLFSLP